jgi:HD-GYP domain-containing protein (c-di-GMP phosphodiesterase class II)
MSRNGAVKPSERLYSSRITATYIRFLRQEYSHVDIDGLLSYAGMEIYQIEDDGCWFTQDQVDRFNERLVQLTGKPDISREAGRFGFSPDSIGFVKSYILGCMSIGRVYDTITKITSKFVKSSTFHSVRLAPNRTKIIVTPRPGAEEKPYQCQNRMGYFEAVCKLFRHKFPTIEHTKCAFEGAECCEYVVTWREFSHETWKKIRTIAGTFLLAFGVAMLYWNPPLGLIATAGMLAVLFVLSYYLWDLEKKELRDGIDNLSRSTDEVVKKMETSIKNMDFARQVIVAISLESSQESMMKQIAALFEKELDYDRGMIFLANEEKSRLVYKTSFGYTEKWLALLENMNPSLRPDSTGIFALCFRERKPFLINDLDEIAATLSPRSLVFAKQMGARAFICVPIVSGNEALGVLAVDNVMTKRPLLQSDLDLLMRIAPEIGMALQNVTAIEDKERQFHSILQALASSIDARDPLTAGHSDRVTLFAVGIAKEMGLSYDTIEMIRVSALLHDYGKIGIGDSILKKPGKLTDAEYNEIKTHAAKTKQILDKIEFQGAYREVPEVASSHHEKFDGTGYPMALKGTGIPLGARILAVADVFEALTARRHYRDPMPLNGAFEILQRDKGKHFDPQVVDAFVRFYEKDGKLLDASINANIRTKDPGDGHDHKRSSAGDQILEMPRKKQVEAIELNTRGT